MSTTDWLSLALKLVVAPGLILAASLAGKRWGEAVGGWLVGLPLVSGPVVFILVLEHGAGFAAGSATGSVAGIVAQAAFALGYGWAAERFGIAGGLLAGSASFALVGGALQRAALPMAALFPLAALALGIAILAFPRRAVAPRRGPAIGDLLPLRMLVAAGVVFAITTAAPVLGPRLAGLMTTFPVMAAILAGFGQRAYGAGAGRRVLLGLLLGLYGFLTFFVVIGVAIEPLGIPLTFLLACGAAVLVQGGSLVLIRRLPRLASPVSARAR